MNACLYFAYYFSMWITLRVNYAYMWITLRHDIYKFQ